MARRVIITGAAGFIGAHVCEALADAGWAVLGIDRNPAPKGFRGEFEQLDIAQSPKLAGVCADARHIVHLAALASVEASARDPGRSRRDTVETTRRLLAACRGARRFVLASTAAVYSPDAPIPQREDVAVNATGEYAQAKIECEALVRDAACDGVALRLFNVYGHAQQEGIIPRVVAAAIGGRLRIQGDGEQTRDFLHVRDAARAIIAALRRERDFRGLAINIGSGAEISVNALVRLAVEVGGRPINVEYVAARPGDLRRSCADTSLARAELDFAPETKLADGLADLLG